MPRFFWRLNTKKSQIRSTTNTIGMTLPNTFTKKGKATLRKARFTPRYRRIHLRKFHEYSITLPFRRRPNSSTNKRY